ncbi:transmembrane protein 131 homolog [Battus philenor]|uniref:transmembrane protein 131 homolog n=1 Tax=Battus philenor TaxID=42288 RepID=UPI0035D119E2
MCRKMMYCYILVLTLLDCSLKTKLTAQGKSHGATLHESLVEGINFQEWGGGGGGGGGGGSTPQGLVLEPAALRFGPAALATPHARTVTLTNTANTTLHLASVAGTTPDFHASFFESKTLAPRGNTSFSVVYLGRREGPASAHLYIHTSLGVHEYPVSAVGVASEYDVWPLLGVRVPVNASVEPVLTLYNPTDRVIQVSEVYSSGAWVGLQLPSGGESAPRDAWAVPPRATRDIVRLRLAPPTGPAGAPRPLTAYVRLRADVPGGALVVCVEARAAAAGEHAAPLQLHMRARGAADPPLTVTLRAANSARAVVQLEAALRGARCVAAPNTPPEPCEPPHAHAHNGGEPAVGARLTLLRDHLDPLQDFAEVARLKFDYGELWASAGGAAGEAREVRCAGCVRVGRAALPYTLRLLPGTLRLEPPHLHFVTSEAEGVRRREAVLTAHNDCTLPLHVQPAELSPDAAPYFEMSGQGAVVLQPGGSAAVARLRLLERGLLHNVTLDARVTLRTNLSEYSLPVLVYSGRFELEWEWPWGAEEARGATVSLGALGTSASRRVGVRLRNASPARLCARELSAELSAGSAQLTLPACPAAPAAPPDHPCRCVDPGRWAQGWLVVVAPARAGQLRGHVLVRSQHAATHAALSLRALAGRLHAHPLLLPAAAPYAWSSAEIILESTMDLEMFVTNVTQPTVDAALTYRAGAAGQRAAVRAGRQAVGSAQYAPERHCQPACYTGIDLLTYEGSSWMARAAVGTSASLSEDVELVAERLAMFHRLQREQPAARNLTLYVHTTEVVQVPVTGAVRLHWPRVASGGVSEGAGGVLAAVGTSRSLRVSARNPSASHALLLQPVVAADLHLPDMAGGSRRCANGSCAWAPQAFRLAGWRAARGDVREWSPAPGARAAAGPVLLLAPLADVDFTLSFAPHAAARLAAYLYLRNNLTVVEGVLVTAEGVHPSFELAGRKPGSPVPIMFEVTECGGAGGAGEAGVRRTVTVRNTGRVGVRLRDWRVAGRACQARGFRLQPCAPLALAPNESRALHLAFAPDFTLARVAARLHLRSELGRADFALQAAVPARLLPRCAAAAPRPPWEPALRAAASVLAFAALALVLAAAAFDAERLLRRARAARAQPAPRAPLDLRAAPPALAAPAPAAVPRPQPARRRRPPRRPLPPLDPLAERRAFERWRAEVLRRADDDDERSSEDADSVSVDAEPPPSTLTSPAPLLDDEPYDLRPDTPPPVDNFEPDRDVDDDEEQQSNSGEEDVLSTGSDSSPASDRGEPEERSEPDESETVADRDTPTDITDEMPEPPVDVHAPSGDSFTRACRPRRESGDAARRAERLRAGGDAAPARVRSSKPHVRKDKSAKRRCEKPSAPPSRDSPAPADAEVPGPSVSGCSAGGGAVRWGASWSSVVAARALAPIGSDVRRRAGGTATGAGAVTAAPPGAAAGDHSLFYFNGATGAPRAELPWPAPTIEIPYQPARDYLEEASGVGSVGSVGPVGSVGGGYGSLGGAWGGAWAWGAAGAVRPPPGFGAPPRPPRAYDPFRSLASIWAPGAADWRLDAEPAGQSAATPDPDER